jgi:hypothetical protein
MFVPFLAIGEIAGRAFAPATFALDRLVEPAPGKVAA